MAPPKSHMRAVAPVHMLADHTQDFHYENFDHETDLESINEEHDDTRDACTITKSQRLPFVDHSEESDSNYTTTSLSDIIVDGLPTAVKVLGPLRTIRRSASIRSWVSYFYEISTSSMGAQVSHEEHHGEGGHHEHHTLVATSTTTTEVEMSEQHQHQHHQPMNSKRRRASNTMRSSKGQAPSTELVEYVEPERKGIDRFCGMQGASFTSLSHLELTSPYDSVTKEESMHIGQLLVNNALSERRASFSQSRGGAAADGDHSNERRAYVQGLAWLLQGLPQDLDEQERQDLTRSMPSHLLQGGDMDRNRGHRRLGPPSSSSSQRTGRRRSRRSDDDGRSFIQRAVAALIVQLIGPMQILWAYLLTLLGHAIYLERKYKVTEHVVKHSGELGYTMGKNGVKLSGVIYHNGGARVGAVLTDAVAYVADGVVKGISDGIKEACLELEKDGNR